MLYLLDEPDISFFVGKHHRDTISHVAKTWLKNLAVTHKFLDGKSLNNLEKDFLILFACKWVKDLLANFTNFIKSIVESG